MAKMTMNAAEIAARGSSWLVAGDTGWRVMYTRADGALGRTDEMPHKAALEHCTRARAAAMLRYMGYAGDDAWAMADGVGTYRARVSAAIQARGEG